MQNKILSTLLLQPNFKVRKEACLREDSRAAVEIPGQLLISSRVKSETLLNHWFSNLFKYFYKTIFHLSNVSKTPQPTPHFEFPSHRNHCRTRG